MHGLCQKYPHNKNSKIGKKEIETHLFIRQTQQFVLTGLYTI